MSYKYYNKEKARERFQNIINNETAEEREHRLQYHRVYHEQNKNKIALRKKLKKEKDRTDDEKEKIRKKIEYKNQKEYEYQQDILNKKVKPPGKTHVANKIAIRNLRNKFFNLYGSECVACGEPNECFLTLDHVNNDGYESGHGRGKEEYRKAVKSFSPDKYQVLCYNCNMSKNRKNMQKEGSRSRIYATKLRKKLFDMYGSECACCGENGADNLTLDHVQNNGKELRKKNGNGLAEYRVAVAKYNPETYQILCWNCNLAKRVNGSKCPHKEMVK